MSDAADVLTLENRIAELERLAHWIEEFGARHALDHRAIVDVELAVDELVTNSVTHGSDDDEPHEIRLRQRLDAGCWIVEIEDDGEPFDPRSVPPPPLDAPPEERPIGGLGIHLVRSVVDELGYRREAGRNHVTLRKRVEAAARRGDSAR